MILAHELGHVAQQLEGIRQGIDVAARLSAEEKFGPAYNRYVQPRLADMRGIYALDPRFPLESVVDAFVGDIAEKFGP